MQAASRKTSFCGSEGGTKPNHAVCEYSHADLRALSECALQSCWHVCSPAPVSPEFLGHAQEKGVLLMLARFGAVR